MILNQMLSTHFQFVKAQSRSILQSSKYFTQNLTSNGMKSTLVVVNKAGSATVPIVEQNTNSALKFCVYFEILAPEYKYVLRS